MKRVVVLALSLMGASAAFTAPIAAVLTYVDRPLDIDENAELSQYLSSFVGQDASHENLHAAKEQLDALARYKNTSCQFEKHNNAETLACKLDRIPVLGHIEILGLPVILLEKDLRKRLPIHPGEAVDVGSGAYASLKERVQNTVSSFLERQGFYGAVITIQETASPTFPTIDLVLKIEHGSFVMVREVTLSKSIYFDRQKISSMFSRMCRNFRYAFDALGMYGFSCYSRDKEREVSKKLEAYLDGLGYNTASISVQRTMVDPHDPRTPKVCQAKAGEATRCVDLEVSVDLGPKVLTEFVFKNAQSIDLNPVGQFFRSFFGVEYFSRLLGASLAGARWPSDETILQNELRDAVTFRSARNVDEREIARSIEAMKSLLFARGYRHAQIEAEHEIKGDKLIRVRFVIDPKEPFRVHEIRFNGSPVFEAEEIIRESQISVLPRSASQSGHIDPSELEEDILKLKSFYASRGYPNANIVVDQSYLGTQDIRLTYQIDSGASQVIDEFVIENEIQEFNAELLPLLANCQHAKSADNEQKANTKVCIGSPFWAQSVDEDEKQIAEFYRARGYLYTTVKSKVDQTSRGTKLSFHLNPKSENVLVKVAGVLIDGNTNTYRSVMLRHMGASLFEPNTPLAPMNLEEGVTKLRRSNLYSRIQLKYLGQEDQKDRVFVVLNVTEKPAFTLDSSFAFSTDNLFSIGLEVRDANLAGAMLDWSTKLDLGLFWGRQSILKNSLRWPSIWGLPLDFEIVAPLFAYEDRVTRDPPERHFLSQAFASLKWQLTQTLSPYLKYLVRIDQWQQAYDVISFSHDVARSITTIDGLLIALNEPASTRGVLTPGLSFSDVDHPFDPKKGIKFDIAVELSHALFGAQIPYQMLNAQAAHFITFGPFTLATQLILKRAFIETPESTWWVLKYQSDMDTLGGDRSVRGYLPGTIGIWGPLLNSRDGNAVVDANGKLISGFHPGNLSIQGNLEVRFPLVKNFFIGDLNGAIFSDVGFIDTCTALFSCNGPSLTPSGQDRRLGVSVGVGLRLLLPVGPIVLDYAVSPIERANNLFGRQSRIHVMFGYPF